LSERHSANAGQERESHYGYSDFAMHHAAPDNFSNIFSNNAQMGQPYTGKMFLKKSAPALRASHKGPGLLALATP
jgi:hypothetical protein